MSDLDDLNRDLQRFAEGLRSQDLLNTLGLAAEKRIRNRTRKGEGVDGERFQTPADDRVGAYSASHGRRREKKGLPTGHINLQFDLYEGMLAAMTYEVSKDLDDIELYFDDEEKDKIASYITKEGIGTSGVTYDFFGLNDDDNEAINDLIGEHVDELISLTDFD